MNGGDGRLRLSARDWIGFGIALLGHATFLFCGFLYWANRVVAVETRLDAVVKIVDVEMPEMRADIKELLERTPR